MQRVTCMAGHTQIRRVLNHAQKENARQKVNALVLISDACEERPVDLYNAARELGSVPVFMFQEGDDDHVSGIYAEIARLTGGAHCRFDSGAAEHLADLLKLSPRLRPAASKRCRRKRVKPRACSLLRSGSEELHENHFG
jgi:hypothetical protein